MRSAATATAHATIDRARTRARTDRAGLACGRAAQDERVTDPCPRGRQHQAAEADGSPGCDVATSAHLGSPRAHYHARGRGDRTSAFGRRRLSPPAVVLTRGSASVIAVDSQIHPPTTASRMPPIASHGPNTAPRATPPRPSPRPNGAQPGRDRRCTLRGAAGASVPAPDDDSSADAGGDPEPDQQQRPGHLVCQEPVRGRPREARRRPSSRGADLGARRGHARSLGARRVEDRPVRSDGRQVAEVAGRRRRVGPPLERPAAPWIRRLGRGLPHREARPR